MSPDKLEALRKLAADERTPIEEARNAALQFVRGGGKIESAPKIITIEDIRRVADVPMVREAFGPELDALKKEEQSKRAKLQAEIDTLKAERDAARKQLEDIRAHGKALLAFVQNEPEKPKEQRREQTLWDNPIYGGMPRAVYTR